MDSLSNNLNDVEGDESFDRQRVARVWRFIVVTLFIWLGFAAYFSSRDLVDATKACMMQGAALAGLLVAKPSFKKSLVWVSHFFLVTNLVGIFAISISEGDLLRETAYFLPLGIFVASQLLGTRAASVWAVVITAAAFFRFRWMPSLAPVSNESLVNLLGFSTAVYFFCQQAEQLFTERTDRLKQLTKDLQQQNRTNHFLAITDSLTGLVNRYGLQQICVDEFDRARKQNQELGLLLIDLDKFKEINDTLGHTTGDILLQKMANRLEEVVGNEGTVARLGGDEFCIIAPNIGSPENAADLAGQLHQELCQPYQISGESIQPGASIGISLYPSQCSNDSELLTFADTAMYEAKSSGLDYLVYDSCMTDEVRNYRQLRKKLETALQNDEFCLYYQPQVSFETGQAIGAEALIRWNHNGDLILPDRFIPVLESSGLISDVGRWIIEETCRQVSIWESKGYCPVVSLNVSATQFCDPDFIGHICDSISQYDVSPHLLDFEITESLLVENVDEVIETLNALKALGCSISIDDFGTGYSSLAYLKSFPIDRLKIDREFVRDFPNRDDGLVAASIVALGKALNLRVLAEGVETPEQFRFLKDHGCEEYQGYICSKPVPPEVCEQLFFEHQPADAPGKIRQQALTE